MYIISPLSLLYRVSDTKRIGFKEVFNINFQDKKEILAEVNENIITYNEFNDALIGYVEGFGRNIVALYDRNKCIEILMGHGMTHEEAEEYFCFNVIGAYVGENTPMFYTNFT